MKISVDTEVDQVIILHKKTGFQFVVSEILIYISQVMVFFWVTFLVSGSLNNEDGLANFLNSKINENSLSEVGYIILATVITLGIVSVITRVAPPNGWLDELAYEVLLSMSKTIYFFGSSVTGSLLAVALFSYLHPDTKNPAPEFWLSSSLIYGLGAFLYGCGTSYMFNYKKFIARSSPNKSSNSDGVNTAGS
jgi:hypothetical protein